MRHLLAVFLLSSTAAMASPDGLRVEGDWIKGRVLTRADLERLGTKMFEWVDTSNAGRTPEACAAPAQPTEKGCVHVVKGVRLERVLIQLGFSEGPGGAQVQAKDKHRGLRSAVLASAADGFEAVFSMGEILDTLGATTALVVWEMDGRPLPSNVGPLRILVTSDAVGSRSLRQLTTLRVIDLAKK